MIHTRDSVIDVINVLTIMKRESLNYRSITELRQNAVKEVANTEITTGRRSYFESAKKTIHQACTRRLQYYRRLEQQC
jgi:hypothetical protein